MKTKGIPFWERHLEHMVVALALLILLGFAALQFVGSPNSVSLPQGRQGEMVGPGSVDNKLQEKASALLQGMGPDSQTNFVFPPVTPQAQKFEDLKSALVSSGQPLVPMRPNLHPGDAGAPPPPGTPFVVAKVPAPINLVREQYFDMLLPEEVDELPELKALLTELPHDVTWNTVAATFKVGEVYRQFKNKGPNGEASIPLGWFNDRVDFIDVKLEREEMVDGKWANLTLLNHIPGQFDLRPTLASAIDTGTRDTILSQVNDPVIRTEIIQPEFYKSKNAAWSPPDKDGKQDDLGNIEDPVQLEIATIKKEIADKTRRKDTVEAQMKANNCPAEAPPKPSPSKKPSGSSGSGGTPAPGSGGGGVGEGSGKGLGGRPGQGDKPSPACDRLRHQLATVKSQLEKLQDRLDAIQGAEAEKEPEKKEEKPVEVGTPDEIAIWAHDLTIQPGKTYRYRFTVEVFNPLFAQKIALIDSQKPMAEKFTLASQASEWSAPMEVQPWMRVFVTRAQSGNTAINVIGPQQAQVTAEVFRYRAGRWWLSTFPVTQGDRVGQIKETREAPKAPLEIKAANPAGAKPADKPADEAQLASVDYRTDWFVLDVVEDLEADAAAIRSGQGASVILQSLASPSVYIKRSPRADSANSERRRLAEEVKAAEYESTVASTPAKPAQTPGGAAGQ